MNLLVSRLCFLFLFLTSHFFYAQKTYLIETFAFYNLENLFDTINNLNKMDELSPIMALKSNRSFVYQDKINRLSKVLTKVGLKKNKLPPVVIGVVEVENKKVLEDLIKTDSFANFNYGIIHYDSPDKRGIDTALLYNKDVFKPLDSEAFSANIYKENIKIDTRDILYTVGYLLNDKIHLFVNHWPSRRGGVKKTSHLRKSAANRLNYLISNIYKEDANAKVIVMGDFNDNPTSKSLKYLSKESILYNPFKKMYKKGYYTLMYRADMFLFDQILFSTNFIAKNKAVKGFRFYKAGIYNPSYLTTQLGKYKGYPKRSFGGGKYLKGYSDHYPVYTYLIKEKE